MSETHTVLSDQAPTLATAAGEPSAPPPWRALLRWESGLVLVLVATLTFAGSNTENFFDQTDIFYIGLNMGEIAIMALPLTLIVMTGEIDLSVASMLGLSGTLMGYLFQHGWNIYLAIGVAPIQGTQISYSVAIFIGLALVCAVVLHATPLGRSIVAIGLQSEAAHFAGIRVNRIKFWLYVISGLVCALAGILFTLKNASARYDAGTGLELNVVAIVLFGGVSIFGGRGSVAGVVLSVVIVGCLQQALTQMHVDAQVQNIVLGGLLLVSVIVPNGAEALRRIRARVRPQARPPARAALDPSPPISNGRGSA